MDKNTCSFQLEEIKEVFSSVESLAGKITNSAFKGAGELGFSREVIIEVIQSLKISNFYKSMTSFSNHRIWQDVYHAKFQEREIYLKFTKKSDETYLLISFKEK